MIKLFRYDGSLKEYEAIRETAAFWVFPDRITTWNKKGERRESKGTPWGPPEYYRTAEEAIKAFINQAKNKVESLRSWENKLSQAENDLLVKGA